MEKLKIFLLLLVCSLCVVKADINDDIAHMVMSVIDWTVDPCDDFYNFSCGTWLKNTSIPDDSSRFDRSFTPISQRNEAILRTILENPNTKSKINNFYSSCMNTSMIDIIDVQPLFDYIYAIASIEDINDVMYTAGVLQSIGVNVLFNLGVDRDAKNPEMDIALFGQGGISLPDISLYDDKDISQKYIEHITDIYNLIGLSDASTFAKLAFQFEKSLAAIMLPNNELIDPFMVYNKIDMQGLRQINDLPWDYYLLGLGAPNLELLSVDVVSFFKQLAPVVRQNPDATLSYFMWKLIHQFSNQLSKDYVDATFNFFGKVLSGQKVPLPRWRTCVAATDDALPELTGYEFAMKAFPGESKVIAETLLEAIENAMFDDISGLPWMDAQTRTKAIEKLKLIVNMIGFPNPPFNYSDFEPNPTQYLENTLISHATTLRRRLENVGKQSDRYSWGMSADTVNAYYEPTKNEMVFPAGILQTPFFNRSFPLAMNYGGTGMVMGHELTHAFDNQGRDYDGNGVLIDWWTNATSQKFNDKVQCVIDQYSKFEVLPNIFVDGKLTQGENIADMGGIKLSYTSYVAKDSNADQNSIVPGLTNKQLFFVSFAQNWCSLTRPSRQEILIKVDPHSPPRFRVLGPLMNLVDFSKAFNCPVGSKMNPTNRCEVW